MSIITLTTDYGLKDHYVGALKGKIISENNKVTVIDITHLINPFNIAQTSYVINSAYSHFPKNTVHLIAVDGELSKENKHIAMQWNDHFFVCADNGILSMLIQKMNPQKLVEINFQDRLMPDASDEDVLVKVANHLANGGSLNVIGKEIESIKQITEVKPVVSDDLKTIKGNVIYIDHYGNVITNISKKLFDEICKNRIFEISFKTKTIKSIFKRYTDIATSGKYPVKDYEGEKLAVFNDSGFLEIAIFRSNPDNVGSASTLLGLEYRDVITINFL